MKWYLNSSLEYSLSESRKMLGNNKPLNQTWWDVLLLFPSDCNTTNELCGGKGQLHDTIPRIKMTYMLAQLVSIKGINV